MEESAAAQPLRVRPFQNGPFPVLEKIFRHADHVGRGKAGGEHGPNGLAPLDRSFSHLMIDRVGMVQRGERVSVCAVERFDPGLHNVAWSHWSCLHFAFFIPKSVHLMSTGRSTVCLLHRHSGAPQRVDPESQDSGLVLGAKLSINFVASHHPGMTHGWIAPSLSLLAMTKQLLIT